MKTNGIVKKIMYEQVSLSGENPVKARFFDYNHFTFPSHIHNEYEIIYIKEGAGKWFVGDTVRSYRNDELLLIGPELPHHIHNTSTGVKGIIIQFEKSFMDYTIQYYPQFTHIKQLLTSSRQGVRFQPETSAGVLSQILEDIVNSLGINQIMQLVYLLDKMGKYTQREQITRAESSGLFSVITDNRIKKVLSYINCHYTRPVQLSEIASVAAMNPAAFCRYFKEKTGKTYLQYMMELRIGYACRLLKTDGTDISRVAEKCGFMTMTHFGNMFKRYTGMTPTSYRQLAG